MRTFAIQVTDKQWRALVAAARKLRAWGMGASQSDREFALVIKREVFMRGLYSLTAETKTAEGGGW